MRDRKLYLIDSYALIFRAYYAFINNPMRNPGGLNTSTIFGFTLALDELMRKENPTHIIAAFDATGPTFRHELYEKYKANRDSTPEDIKASVPYIKELLEAYKIPVVEKLGYEADDLIGTIAKKAEKEGYKIYMVTPDKDFAQLVSDNIFIYKPGRSGNEVEKWGVDEVNIKFGIQNPEQVIDILALWGDASDNIPGAPGIGEKTSKKLIGKYGSVEKLYENIDEIKGKQRENLIEAKEQVLLSKELATILVNADFEYDLSSSLRGEIDKNRLRNLFDDLDFKNLKSRILGDDNSLNTNKTTIQKSLFEEIHQHEKNSEKLIYNIDTISHNYKLVNPGEELKALLKKLKKLDSFCFDTETTGLDILNSKIVGISFSWNKNEAVYIDFSKPPDSFNDWIDDFKELFDNQEKQIVGQNLKYDMHILRNYGILVKGKLFDTMVAHYLLHPERRHGIDTMAEEYLGYQKIKTETLIGKKGSQQINFINLDPLKVCDYACEDADIAWQLFEIFNREIAKNNLQKLFYDIEMPLVRVIMEMEHNGVHIDINVLKEGADKLRSELVKTELKIYELAGTEFNINSPKQLGEILFEKLKIDSSAKRTKSKQFTTSEEVLSKLEGKHEIIKEVLNFRSSRKLLSTYIEALPKLIHQKSNKIHTSFNQTLVSTGRLSSNNPNLQNIPIREERGREIRRAFSCSSPNHTFLSADYSQIELRLMAHLSGDIAMINAFQNDEDIHTTTASKVYKVTKENVTREMRSKAKTANFGIIYGISVFGLSQRMRIPRSEAKELIDGYFSLYPAVKNYMDQCIKQAQKQGYVTTMYGRKRYLPDILSRNSLIRGNAERNAINSPIQGSAADIIKFAMVKIYQAFQDEKLQSQMIIQVHDELNFDVPNEELNIVQKIVRESMENIVSLSVPLVVDMNTGKNWLEAH